MTTITRGAVTLTPALVLPVRLVRAGRTVVHQIVGDAEPDITAREPMLLAGDVEMLWPTASDAHAAVSALSTVGGPWTFTDTGDCDGTFTITGDVVLEPAADGVSSRRVTVTVQEVTA